MPGPETPPSAAKPDGYIPPPGAWADSLRGAAAEAENAPGPDAQADEDDGPSFTPEDVEEMLGEAADRVIEFQIWLQSWLAKKGWIIPGAKVKTAPVADGVPGHARAKAIWKRCFKKLARKYAPDLGDIPEWISAPILVAAITLPVQFGEGAELIDDAAAAQGTASDAQAPAAAAA
jgi:hypothetical protein